MLDAFWQAYRTYRDTDNRERVSVPVPGGAIELYYSMSSVRAAFNTEGAPFADSEVWEKAVLGFAATHGLLTDFRDDSYVLTTDEGVYYARLRIGEFLFTPERFGDQPELLRDLIALY